MKKLSFIMLFLFMYGIAFSQSFQEVGSGTVSTTYPIYGSWAQSWFSAIYPAQTAIGTNSITHLSFHCSNGPKTANNQKIYLKLTNDATFANASYENPTTNGYTLVFDGNITFNGWTQIDITDFPYDGLSNIIVHWESRNGDFNYQYPNFNGSASSINNNKSSGSDGAFPTGSGFLNPYPSALPNIRFYYTSSGPQTPVLLSPVINVEKVNLNTALSFQIGTNTTHYDVYFSTDSLQVANFNASAKVADNIAIVSAGTYNYQPASILTPSTHYYWRVVAKSGTQTEATAVSKFKTQFAIQNFPYSQGFEDEEVFVTGYYGLNTHWYYPATGDNAIWYKSSASFARTGQAALSAQPSSSVSQINSAIVTPRMFLPNNYRISFWWINGTQNKVAGHDSTFFEITNDGGATWTTLAVLSPQSAQSQYQNVSINLNAYAGNNVYMRWRYKKMGASTQNTYIDDIVIEEDPSAPIIEVVSNSIDFGNIYQGAYTKKKISIRNDGTQDLIISSIETSSPFSANYSGTITPGQLVDVDVVFTPTSVNTFQSSLTIHSNANLGDSVVALNAVSLEPLNTVFETFETVALDNLPTNWSKIKSDDPNQTLHNVGVKNSPSDAQSAPNVLRMYNNTDTISPLLLIMPGVKNFDSNTLKFYAAKSYANPQTIKLFVGLLSDPNDAATFVAIDSVVLNDSQTQYSFSFNALNTIPYVAFKHGNSKPIQSIWIDNVEWESVNNVVPNCVNAVFPVNDTTNIEAWSARLNWTPTGGNPQGYRLSVGTNNPPSNLLDNVDVGDTLSYFFSNDLQWGQTYYWQVKPYNSFGENSTCEVFSFTVMPDPTITVYPWNEGFESVPATSGFNYPLGWRIFNGGDQFMSWDVIQNSSSSPNNAHSGTNAMHTAFAFLNPLNDWLISPPLQLESSKSYSFSFWLRSPYYVDGQDTTAEKFRVVMGKYPVADSMTTVLYQNESLRMVDYQNITSPINVPQNGVYYIGFHSFSEPMQWLIIVDDVMIDISTAIGNEMTINDFKIYPNPAKSNIVISSDFEENSLIQVYDSFGRMVMNEKYYYHKSYDISGLAKGMYFVRLSNSQKSAVQKFMVE